MLLILWLVDRDDVFGRHRQKSRRCPMCLYPIRLSSGSSGPCAENAWTARYSGPPPTWRPSYSISNIMSIERAPDAKGSRR